MSYLDRISHLDTADAENGSEYEINEKTRDTCSECKWGLRLSESQALGRCIRCQSEAESADTLVRLAIGRERTHRAVEARIAQCGRRRGHEHHPRRRSRFAGTATCECCA
jgi:hypothetical protein